MTKHYTIPFFVPHQGCPHQCVFCDQDKITATQSVNPSEIPKRIEQYLATISLDSNVEVGFFGGTFTGLSRSEQEEFLKPVQKYLKNKQIHGIRLSTRPDLITEDILTFLGERGVRRIELGVQSMSDSVLSAAKRGHTAKDVEGASRMIIEKGFSLGHQMMLGLPESTFGDECFTAQEIKRLGASEVRIYPVVVIEGTELAREWADSKYVPLTEAEAVNRSARLILYFDSNDIMVIRCGLHPSSELTEGGALLDGPFHEAFRLKADSLIFSFMLDYVLGEASDKVVNISLNPKDEAAFFGFERKNLSGIEKILGQNYKDFLKRDKNIPRGGLLIKTDRTSFSVNRKTIAELHPVIANPEQSER